MDEISIALASAAERYPAWLAMQTTERLDELRRVWEAMVADDVDDFAAERLADVEAEIAGRWLDAHPDCWRI